MEAVVAVLRPNPQTSLSLGEFRPRLYEVLLMETKKSQKRSLDGSMISDDEPVVTSNERNTVKHLPTTNIVLDEEPGDALAAFLYNFTGGDSGGLKAKHTVFVPPPKHESGVDDSYVCGTLYCITVDASDISLRMAQQPSLPTFYNLENVLQTLNSTVLPYSKQSRIMLLRLHSWLQEQHCIPGQISLLFSTPPEDRLKWSITNPAYRDDYPIDEDGIELNDSLGSSNGAMLTPSKSAHAKMLKIDKCNLTKINPLFGSDLVYKCKVDKVAVNKFWGLGKPDYSKISSTTNNGRLSFLTDTHSKPPPQLNLLPWANDYPLHKCAMDGDADGIRQLLKDGWSAVQKDGTSDAPIHHAARHGHIKAVDALLTDGNCSPNITNDTGSTPLHIAASQGKIYVIELLLTHQDIDVNALDQFGKTALKYCENIEKTDWQSSANLLRFSMNRPTPTIQVFLMDGSCRLLNLVSKANTTVQQLHQQMMKILSLPDSCNRLFTIWICSRNLQLQLKPEHKPIQHLNDWKRRIVIMLTDQDPNTEDPQLFWRRDAILSIEDEKKVKNFVAINLLFLEAYHNYIKSLYPCSEHDATILAGILMQMNHGDYDEIKLQQYMAEENMLPRLIPVSMIQQKSINWSKNVVDQYKHYNHKMTTRERNLSVYQIHFLTVCWNLTAYGSAFFTGYVPLKGRVPTPVYIGVNDIGLHIITVDTKTMWKSFAYGVIEWSLKRADYPMLEIKGKGSSSRQFQGANLHTKQAGLINHLMNKLSQLNPGN